MTSLSVLLALLLAVSAAAELQLHPAQGGQGGEFVVTDSNAPHEHLGSVTVRDVHVVDQAGQSQPVGTVMRVQMGRKFGPAESATDADGEVHTYEMGDSLRMPAFPKMLRFHSLGVLPTLGSFGDISSASVEAQLANAHERVAAAVAGARERVAAQLDGARAAQAELVGRIEADVAAAQRSAAERLSEMMGGLADGPQDLQQAESQVQAGEAQAKAQAQPEELFAAQVQLADAQQPAVSGEHMFGPLGEQMLRDGERIVQHMLHHGQRTAAYDDGEEEEKHHGRHHKHEHEHADERDSGKDDDDAEESEEHRRHEHAEHMRKHEEHMRHHGERGEPHGRHERGHHGPPPPWWSPSGWARRARCWLRRHVGGHGPHGSRREGAWRGPAIVAGPQGQVVMVVGGDWADLQDTAVPSERAAWSPWRADGRPHWGLLAFAGLSVGCALVWLSLLAQCCVASCRRSCCPHTQFMSQGQDGPSPLDSPKLAKPYTGVEIASEHVPTDKQYASLQYAPLPKGEQ